MSNPGDRSLGPLVPQPSIKSLALAPCLETLLRPNRYLSTYLHSAIGENTEKEKVGEVFHYFTKAGVAAINLTDSYLQVGDTILFQGVTTNFSQKVESLQIENAAVQRAELGQSVGIKVKERVREKDLVYRILQE